MREEVLKRGLATSVEIAKLAAPASAEICAAYYQALRKEGFTEGQAMEFAKILVEGHKVDVS